MERPRDGEHERRMRESMERLDEISVRMKRAQAEMEAAARARAHPGLRDAMSAHFAARAGHGHDPLARAAAVRAALEEAARMHTVRPAAAGPGLEGECEEAPDDPSAPMAERLG